MSIQHDANGALVNLELYFATLAETLPQLIAGYRVATGAGLIKSTQTEERLNLIESATSKVEKQLKIIRGALSC